MIAGLLPLTDPRRRDCPRHMLDAMHQKLESSIEPAMRCPGCRSPGNPHPGTRAWCDRDVQAPRDGHRRRSPPMWQRTGEGDVHPPGSGGDPGVARTQSELPSTHATCSTECLSQGLLLRYVSHTKLLSFLLLFLFLSVLYRVPELSTSGKKFLVGTFSQQHYS